MWCKLSLLAPNAITAISRGGELFAERRGLHWPAARKASPAKIDHGFSAGRLAVLPESKGKCIWIKMSPAKTALPPNRTNATLMSSTYRYD